MKFQATNWLLNVNRTDLRQFSTYMYLLYILRSIKYIDAIYSLSFSLSLWYRAQPFLFVYTVLASTTKERRKKRRTAINRKTVGISPLICVSFAFVFSFFIFLTFWNLILYHFDTFFSFHVFFFFFTLFLCHSAFNLFFII